VACGMLHTQVIVSKNLASSLDEMPHA